MFVEVMTVERDLKMEKILRMGRGVVMTESCNMKASRKEKYLDQQEGREDWEEPTEGVD